jgi:hypothetical protein
MPIFDKNSNSMFETLSKSRAAVLGKPQVIPPPGALARPGMKLPAPAVKNPPKIPTSVLERAVDDLLDVDGDPILVVDDELDVSTITPEDAVTDEPPAQLLGVRADTAVVFGIGLCLVVAIAYFAGRTTTKPGDAPKVAQAMAIKPPAPIEIKEEKKPAAEKPAEAAPAEEPAAPPKPVAPEGSYEIHLVTTTDENAAKVIAFFNNDMMSPTYGKGVAYAKKGLAGSQVRIKGFEKEDAAILAAVRAEKDPTNGRPGAFAKAEFRKMSVKK